jgi:hypothetical protein
MKWTIIPTNAQLTSFMLLIKQIEENNSSSNFKMKIVNAKKLENQWKALEKTAKRKITTEEVKYLYLREVKRNRL